MSLPATLIETLTAMPLEFERVFRLIPEDKLNWQPDRWDGIPGERFSALGQACHIRDIEIDGYHVRIRRMLEEIEPELAALDSYYLARERRYSEANAAQALASFRAARTQTVRMLGAVSTAQLARGGMFAEYGHVSLEALIHYLRSHDQQHLACMHWLLGKIASR